MGTLRALVLEDLALLRRQRTAHLAATAVTGVVALAMAAGSFRGFRAALDLAVLMALAGVVGAPLYAYSLVAREWMRRPPGWISRAVPGWVRMSTRLLAATGSALAAWLTAGAFLLPLMAIGRARWSHNFSGMTFLAIRPTALLLDGTVAAAVAGASAAVWLLLVALSARRARHWPGVGRWAVGAAVAAIPLVLLPRLTAALAISRAVPLSMAVPVGYTPLHAQAVLYLGAFIPVFVLTAAAFWTCSWLLDRGAP